MKNRNSSGSLNVEHLAAKKIGRDRHSIETANKRNHMFKDQLRLAGLLLITAMAGCGGGGGGGTSSRPPAGFSVGGSVNGLVGNISLQLNDTETLRVDSNGAFIFRTTLPAGAYYVVTRVLPDPTFTSNVQVCTVSNSHGLATANVTDISITCVTPDNNNVTKISNTHGSALQLASNASGTAFAVWTQSVGGRSDIWASRSVGKGIWDIPVLLESNDLGNANNPKIAVDAAGNAVAVWDQSNGTSTDIWSSRYNNGSGWSPATLVELNPSRASNPAVAIDANGNALVVWPQARPGAFSGTMWANRYALNSGWETEAIIGSPLAADPGAGEPDVAIDASGNAVAVWPQLNGNFRFSFTYANYYSVGTGWGTVTGIASGSLTSAQGTKVAIDPFGNALAVWRQSGIAGIPSSYIWSNRYVAGSGWSTATPIQAEFADASTPQIAVDVNGNALAVWAQPDAARISIWANRYVAGTTRWGTATVIETDSSGDASAPKVVANADGSALVVWPQVSLLGAIHLWANRYSPASGWGQVTLVQANVGTKEISITPKTNGPNLVLWSDSAGVWVRSVD